MATPTRNLADDPNAIDRTLINVNKFRATATTATGFYAGAALVTDADRENQTPKERYAFYTKCIVGLDAKFSLKQDLSFINDPTKSVTSDYFTKSLDFTLQIQRLKQHMERHLLQSVFYILNVEEVITPGTNARQLVKRDDQTVYLLDGYSGLNLTQVIFSTEYYVTYSEDNIDAENLQWSQEMLLNSCDEELKGYLESRLCLLPESQHGGPTLFMIMVEQIISNNEHLSRSLITRLNSFQITSIPGENIEQAAAFITTICKRLNSCQKLPPDIARIVFDIMLTCTVDRFKQHFYTLESGDSPKLLTYESVLREAVRFYTVLYTGINQWLPTTTKGSIYVNNGSPGLPRSQASPNKTSQTHDAKGNPIDRCGPAKGEALSRDSKVNEGKKEYWCSTCDRWGSHDADHHDAWKTRMKEFYDRKKGPKAAANIMEATDTPTTPAPTTAAATLTAGSNNFTMVERLKYANFDTN